MRIFLCLLVLSLASCVGIPPKEELERDYYAIDLPGGTLYVRKTK